MLHMRSELNLGLKSTKLTCFLEGDRVGAIQDIIPSLQHKRKQKASGAWGDQHNFSSAMFLAPKPTLSREMRGSVPAKPEWGIHSGCCERRQHCRINAKGKEVRAQTAYGWKASAMPSILKTKAWVQSREVEVIVKNKGAKGSPCIMTRFIGDRNAIDFYDPKW